MIFDLIIDHTPWWVFVIGGLAIVGGLLFFFSPILVPIWAAIPRPVKVVLGGIVAVAVAFIAGRNRGTRDEQEREKARDAEAMQRRADINQDVANSDDADVDKRLGKWMRD